MTRVRWWHSAIFAALIAAYLIYGLTGGDLHANDNDIYDVGGVMACIASLAFIVIYTLLGLRPGRAGWWTNLTGYSLMVLSGAIFAKEAVLAWAVLFHHGLINTAPSAWLFVGTTWLLGLAMLSLCLLWVWNRNAGAPPPPDETPASH